MDLISLVFSQIPFPSRYVYAMHRDFRYQAITVTFPDFPRLVSRNTAC